MDKTPHIDVDELLTLCEAIAPELLAGDRKLHILNGDELGLLQGNSVAWCHDADHLDLDLRDVVGDEWPVVALFPNAIAEKAGSKSGVQDACLKRTFLHELAHALPAREPIPASVAVEIDTPQMREFQRNRVARSLETHAPPWQDAAHNHHFCRRCCHLFVRSQACGFADIPLSGMFYRLGQSRESWYLEACLGEAVRMLDASFDEIASEPLPEQLLDLWLSDVDRMRELFA